MSDFTVQELTLGQLLENTAARFPDTDAVIHADRELRQTWSEFSACVDDMARGLMAIGVQKGEKVAVWATNVPHWVTLMFATARIGAILVTVNTNYRETELRYLLQQSECENLFIIDSVRDHDFIASTYEVLPELRRQRRGMLEVEGLPDPKRVFFLGTDKHRGMYSLPELFSLAGDVSDEEYESRKASISPYDVVNMQYTSGTTGFPKGVMLTHVNIVNNGYWIGYHQKIFLARPGMPARASVPLLRLRARGHGLREPRGHHGAARRLLPRAGDDRRGAGEVHRPVRRADHVPGHFGSPRLLAFRFFLAAYGDHGRVRVP